MLLLLLLLLYSYAVYLCCCLQTDASKQSDVSASQRLLDAAKQLAAATAKMVSAGSDSARNLKDPNAQDALKKAAEDLRIITTTVASQVSCSTMDTLWKSV